MTLKLHPQICETLKTNKGNVQPVRPTFHVQGERARSTSSLRIYSAHSDPPVELQAIQHQFSASIFEVVDLKENEEAITYLVDLPHASLA